jgi:hypothetical protein
MVPFGVQPGSRASSVAGEEHGTDVRMMSRACLRRCAQAGSDGRIDRLFLHGATWKVFSLLWQRGCSEGCPTSVTSVTTITAGP